MEPIPQPAEGRDHEAQEQLLLHTWRTEQLGRLGLHRLIADAYADRVDWHALADLVERGCAPELALEILR